MKQRLFHVPSFGFHGLVANLAKAVVVIVAGIWTLTPFLASADAVGLQLAPLKYEQTITGTKPQLGFINVSNPSDTTVTITSSVQGFRQTDNAGDLTYYDDPVLAAGIKPDLASFTLGSREAVRVGFTVDPALLPHAGIYAVIFFRTVPADQSAGNSFVSESAKVGTLLILNNGNAKPAAGTMSLSLPRIQLGNAITGTINYRLPGGNIGSEPQLTSQIYPWGKATALKTGLVLPASSRSFSLQRPGSYFGIIPISVAEPGGTTTTAWTFAITGWYQTLIAIIIALIIALALRKNRRPRSLVEQILHPLDGLSRRG